MYVLGKNFDDSKYCVKITTGNEQYDEGSVKVMVNGAVTFNGFKSKGMRVVDQCWDVLQTVKLSGPLNNAWRGQVIITSSGKPTSITCEECSGSTSLLSGSIVVESDSDSASWGDTQCLNGKTCPLTWKITGSSPVLHNYLSLVNIIFV